MQLTISILALGFLVLNAVMPVGSEGIVPRLEYVSVNQDESLISMGKRALVIISCCMVSILRHILLSFLVIYLLYN